MELPVSIGMVNRDAEDMIPHPPGPYSPSWIDRLTDWIDRRPGPACGYYLAIILLVVGGQQRDDFLLHPLLRRAFHG